MKNALFFSGFAVIFAAALVFSLTQTASLKKETLALKASLQTVLNRPAPPPPRKPVEPPIEVADIMTTLQRHANKLYFAGERENWKLADFYVEEIEETAKEFAKKDVMHGQINISGLMGALILPEIIELERAVSQGNKPSFREHYKTLIVNCNLCHTAANLPFIVIQDPVTPAYDNQRYEWVTPGATNSAPEKGLTSQPADVAIRAHTEKP